MTMQAFAGFVRRRRRWINVALVALSALVLTTVTRSYYLAQREADARAELSHVISSFNKAVGTRSAKEGFERIIIDAQNIRDTYGPSSVSELAQYYIAISEETLGRTDRAVQNLQDLIRDGEPTMKHLAQFALGAIYSNHGDMQRAMEVYQELEESGAYSMHGSHSGTHRPETRSAGRPSF